MTEQEKIQSTIEENVNAAVDQISKTAESVTTLGRKVTRRMSFDSVESLSKMILQFIT